MHRELEESGEGQIRKKHPKTRAKKVSEAETVPLPVTLKKTLTNKKCSTTVFKKQGTVLLKG